MPPLEEKAQKKLQLAKKAAKETNETLELWKSTKEMFSRWRKPVFGFFKKVAHAIPPIKLALDAISTVCEVATSLVNSKKSTAQKATKTGLAITGLTLAAASFAVPTIAVGALIAGAAMNLIKDSKSCLQAWRKHSTHKTVIAEKNKALVSAQQKNDTELTATHQRDLKNLHQEKQHLQTKAANKTITHGLTTMAFVGAVLLPTPLAPVGTILLVASAALGLAHSFGKWLFGRKSTSTNITTRVAASEKKTTTNQHHTQNHLTDADHTTLSLNKNLGAESTAQIYSNMAATVHGEKHSIQEEALHELQHSLEKPISKPEALHNLAENHNLHHVEEFFTEPHQEQKKERRIHKHAQSPKPKQTPPDPRDTP